VVPRWSRGPLGMFGAPDESRPDKLGQGGGQFGGEGRWIYCLEDDLLIAAHGSHPVELQHDFGGYLRTVSEEGDSIE
jgi:hypothetical protein